MQPQRAQLCWVQETDHARRYDDYAAFKAGVKELELMMAMAMRTALGNAPGLRLQLENLAVRSTRILLPASGWVYGEG